MNVKNNKRKKESIKKIDEAFFTLLEKKELKEIKVSELCKLASINRSTFYANYVDIFDLADKLRQELSVEANRIFYTNERFNKSPEAFHMLLEHIKENRQLYVLYFKLGYEDRAPSMFNVASIVNEVAPNLNPDMIDYHIEFFHSGFNAIIKKWLKNGCDRTPREICDVLLREYGGRFSSLS